MEEAKTRLLEYFYQGFNIMMAIVIFSIVSAIGFSLYLLVRWKKINKKEKLVVSIGIIIFIALAVFFLSVQLIDYYKDHLYLQSNEPVQIEGTVIGFAHATGTRGGPTHYSWPIVKTKGTEVTISLGVSYAEDRLKLNHSYTFIYLPNTLDAEIVEE